MENYKLSRREQQMAREWAADESWVKQKMYSADKEYLECVRDILDSPVFQSMDCFIQHGNTTCKSHCIQVSYLSYCLCRKFNWDYRQAARGGLLHDLFLYDWHTYAKETGHHFHGFTHPRVAMENSAKYFNLTDLEKDIILRHMWPLTVIPPKSIEGMTVSYADKFCSLAEVAGRIKQYMGHLFHLGRTA